jgi:FPC/CPF motif-containing protein YcgG
VNPFDTPLALDNSSYLRHHEGRLIDGATSAPAPDLAAFVHDGLRALVLNERFTCIGAKSAFRRNAYRFGLYADMQDDGSIAGLARDLSTFVGELPTLASPFATYVASFAAPQSVDERTFERRLWAVLQALHDLDTAHHEWDPAVSADPEDVRFSFSFATTAFFVVGLHAASSRTTRRFAWPTLVFNPHRQFETLREDGAYARFQQVIRAGEQSLQGDVNPMLSEYGERSEARQYSGRRVEAEWKCPFHAHPNDEPPSD